MQSNISIILLVVLYTFGNNLSAQAPEKISYQAVFRDSVNELISEDTIGLQLSLLQDSINGVIIYSETHEAITNENGLVSLDIGGGTAVTGSFSSINWSAGTLFIRVEADLTGGSNYAIMGTSQLLSVPYALFSNKAAYAENVALNFSATGDTLFVGENNFIIIPGLSTANTPINVPFTPVECDGSTLLVEVTNPVTGRIWMDRNLGVAADPGNPNYTNSYGGYYQWGRFTDGHQCYNSATTDTMATTWVPNMGNPWDGKFIMGTTPTDWLQPSYPSLWNGLTGDNNPCPAGFRVPTSAEWVAESNSWSTKNSLGALNSPLKLLLPGRRNPISGVYGDVGSYGYYWSSTVASTNADFLSIGPSNAAISNTGRRSGNSVRCIKD